MDRHTRSLRVRLAVVLVLHCFPLVQQKPQAVITNYVLLVHCCRWWRKRRGHQESYLHTW